jgi:hypothetical protein
MILFPRAGGTVKTPPLILVPGLAVVIAGTWHVDAADFGEEFFAASNGEAFGGIGADFTLAPAPSWNA